MLRHIYHGGDVFVSSDKHFHQVTKQQELIEISAKSILIDMRLSHWSGAAFNNLPEPSQADSSFVSRKTSVFGNKWQDNR